MSQAIDSRDTGLAAASKRLRRSTAVTHTASTGIFTVAAAFLNDLQPGDVVEFTALTGGSTVTQGVPWYIVGARFASGATTFQISATPGGPPLTTGTNITAGNVLTGNLSVVEDGVLSGNIVSQDSVAGR